MAAASSSSSSSFSVTAKSKYEVFLSFRGEDTGFGFASHLAEALGWKQIEFFIDDEERKRGDEISSAVLDAIETSDISIIIFSKDYSSSKWCLNELVKILDCKQMNGQIVLPVFYEVDPSDVRNKSMMRDFSYVRGSFGDSFVHRERNSLDFLMNEFTSTSKYKKWMDALTQASNMAGYHSAKFRSDAGLVEKIAEDVSEILEDMSDSTDLDGFFGLHSRIKKIKSLLSLELPDARIVGIWGMGGIGKTTLVSAVFDQISRDFQGKCFMTNVREESNKIGVIHVRDEVISQVLGESLKVETLTLPQNIKKRLQHMKVLVVLDDVHDEFTQLESLASLAGEIKQFGPGSRIIITTIDKRVLDKCGVNNVCEVRGLRQNKALELFRRKAFRENNHSDELLELSKEVVWYANGNPLALEVLGSSLYQKSEQQWKDKLHSLKLITDPNIYKVLKISYDELNSEEQELFLDIACFFKGEDIDFVARIHDNPTSIRNGLNILAEKSLIKTSFENRLQMHNLLQEIGQTIVRLESLKEPGKRSRLWDHEDVCQVLKGAKGTNTIEGIFLDLSKTNDIHLNSRAFANMSNLKLLKFYMPKRCGVPIMRSKVHLDQGLECLPNELRCLHWHEYPLTTLPLDFKPENLIELNLPYSKVDQIWEGKKNAFKLKSIDLSHSQSLIKLLDSSEAPNLERINLLNCTNLASVPKSIQNCNHLKMLSFQGCKSLRFFPGNIHFVSPVTIDFSYCENLTELPLISGNIIKLDLSGTAIEEIGPSIEWLAKLENLHLDKCTRLQRLPSGIFKLKSLLKLNLNGCRHLQSLPPFFSILSLITLDLSDCGLMEIPQRIDCLSSLKELLLRKNNFECLPASVKQLSQLKSLDLRYCSKLQSLPELPLSLKYLDASNCVQLQSLPEISPFLEELDMSILEKLSKTTTPWTPDCSLMEFDFQNCLKLNEKVNVILADSELRIQHMAIASLRLFYEKEPCKLSGLSILLPGSKVPKWFSSQNIGSSITLQLPQHCSRNLIGFALCAVLDFKQVSCDKEGSFNICHRYSFEIRTLSETKQVCVKCFAHIPYFIHSDHVILGFIPYRNVELPDDNQHTTVSFKFLAERSGYGYKVKCCGVCPVYANPNETKPSTFTLKFAAGCEEEYTEIGKLDDKASTIGTSASVGSSDEEDWELSPK